MTGFDDFFAGKRRTNFIVTPNIFCEESNALLAITIADEMD